MTVLTGFLKCGPFVIQELVRILGEQPLGPSIGGVDEGGNTGAAAAVSTQLTWIGLDIGAGMANPSNWGSAANR